MNMYYNNKRLALSIFWMIAGAVLLVLSVTEVLGEPVYAGMGAALIVVGTLHTVRNLKYRKDEEYRRKIDTETGDERISYIRMKSWSWTGFMMVLIEGIGSVIAGVMGERTIQLLLAYSLCLVLVVYWVSYLILSRKY